MIKILDTTFQQMIKSRNQRLKLQILKLKKSRDELKFATLLLKSIRNSKINLEDDFLRERNVVENKNDNKCSTHPHGAEK